MIAEDTALWNVLRNPATNQRPPPTFGTQQAATHGDASKLKGQNEEKQCYQVLLQLIYHGLIGWQ